MEILHFGRKRDANVFPDIVQHSHAFFRRIRNKGEFAAADTIGPAIGHMFQKTRCKTFQDEVAPFTPVEHIHVIEILDAGEAKMGVFPFP